MTVKEFLYNDFTNCYRIEEHGQYPVSSWDIENNKGNIYYFPPLLSFGDYDKSCHVERSNARVFLQEFGETEGIKVLSLPYSSQMIGIPVDCENEEIINTLSSLADYPCLDDNDCSLMEQEMINESWESFGERDFRDQIEKKFDLVSCEGELWGFYNDLIADQNLYIYSEAGGNIYFPSPSLPESLPPHLTIEKYS